VGEQATSSVTSPSNPSASILPEIPLSPLWLFLLGLFSLQVPSTHPPLPLCPFKILILLSPVRVPFFSYPSPFPDPFRSLSKRGSPPPTFLLHSCLLSSVSLGLFFPSFFSRTLIPPPFFLSLGPLVFPFDDKLKSLLPIIFFPLFPFPFPSPLGKFTSFSPLESLFVSLQVI